MNRNTLGPVAVGFLGVLLTYTPIEAQQPAVDNPTPEVATTPSDALSATAWKPKGLYSPRNSIVFRPFKDGSLRSPKNANLGDNGEAAAEDQTMVLRTAQGMPKHLKVHYDAKTNGFYIAAKPDEAKAASVPAAPPPPVTTPTVPNLVISEFFVPSAKLVDATKRTIGLPSGTVTTVPLELWISSKLLNTTEGPVQLPPSLEPTVQPNLLSLDQLPPPMPLPKTGWKNGNAVSRVGSQLIIVRDNKVMIRNKLHGKPQDWVNWCKTASGPDREAGVIPPGYEWVPLDDGRAIAMPMK